MPMCKAPSTLSVKLSVKLCDVVPDEKTKENGKLRSFDRQ